MDWHWLARAVYRNIIWDDLEKYLNHTPYSRIGNKCPDDVLKKLIG